LAYQTGTGSGVRGCSLEISETLLDFDLCCSHGTQSFKAILDILKSYIFGNSLNV